MGGYRSDFSDVSVSVLDLSYTVDGLKLVKLPEPRDPAGSRMDFQARRLEIAIAWREAIRRKALVLTVELDDPKLAVLGLGVGGEKKTKGPNIGETLSRLSPRRYERIEVRNTELTFTDEIARNTPALRLHDLDAAVENLATRVELANGNPKPGSRRSATGP